jgi:hypothetical protein
MVTKLGPLCKVKLLKNDGDKLVVRTPEKAGVGGLTPSPATKSTEIMYLAIIVHLSHRFAIS